MRGADIAASIVLMMVLAMLFASVVSLRSIASSLRTIASKGPVKVVTPIQRVETNSLPRLGGLGVKR